MKRSVLRTKRRHTAGFSLIEVLIALVILGVGLMGLARLQLYLLASTADTAANDHAIRLANDQLEALRFTRITGGTPSTGADEVPVQGMAFNRSWVVTCVPAPLCHVTVRVGWREPRASGHNGQREITLDAHLAPPSAAAQAWLVQSGPPRRETLP